MPFYEKGPVRIHYEEAGTGFPLFIIPGGGLNANIHKLSESHPFNPMEEFKGEYRCIALDLRNANGGQSTGPLEFDRPWEAHAEDMIGLLDHLKIDRFMVMGFCIGNPLIWNLMKHAPGRIVAAQRLQGRPARPLLPDEQREVGPGVAQAPAGHHRRHDRQVSEEDVSRQSGLRVLGESRFRAQLSGAAAGDAR